MVIRSRRAKGQKVVLLFSSGTITTLKEESVLNIKKFAQQKFDPKTAGKLADRKDEPSPSETVIDLSLGDMVVDVKKLKKESSFNIDSPVGTAGIRGTIPRMKVVKLPNGGFNQTTQMLKGSDFLHLPRGGVAPHFLGLVKVWHLQSLQLVKVCPCKSVVFLHL